MSDGDVYYWHTLTCGCRIATFDRHGRRVDRHGRVEAQPVCDRHGPVLVVSTEAYRWQGLRRVTVEVPDGS